MRSRVGVLRHTVNRNIISQSPLGLTAVQQKRDLFVDIYGGRQSTSGAIATVFGCTGFLGRFVVNQLGSIGSQVILPYRGEESAINHLKVSGDLGQIVPVWYNPRDKATIQRAVEHSNVVINLIGNDRETRNFSFEETHIEIPRRIAEVSKEMGINRFINVSCINAHPHSQSHFARTKGLGDQAVLETLPTATILKPCPIFGIYDRWLNTYADSAAWWPWYPVFLPERKVQPIYAVDFAAALLNVVASNEAMGKTYEIGGPLVYTMEQINYIVQRYTLSKARNVDVSPSVMKLIASIMTVAKKSKFTKEGIEYLQSGDQVVHNDALNITNLGLEESQLSRIEDVAMTYLRGYRPFFLLNYEVNRK
eukprot:TRINITY_DN7331_c0_g1_i1.p1 TRINITY_DN7331_c0_g1~~TRINITY_DN7331_c0_g1_i1.p1  ORF type:complete len:365 (+),score=68.87 TRINITY_DN7331_c0_g1_i1:85-1179(+)